MANFCVKSTSFAGALLCSVRDHCEGAEECKRKEWKAGKRWLVNYIKITGELALADAKAALVFPEELEKPVQEKDYLPEQGFICDENQKSSACVLAIRQGGLGDGHLVLGIVPSKLHSWVKKFSKRQGCHSRASSSLVMSPAIPYLSASQTIMRMQCPCPLNTIYVYAAAIRSRHQVY